MAFSGIGFILPTWIVYPRNRVIFNQMEHQWSQYSSIPLFHYSNCERSELSSDQNSPFRILNFGHGDLFEICLFVLEICRSYAGLGTPAFATLSDPLLSRPKVRR